jgi:hypothetical protein
MSKSHLFAAVLAVVGFFAPRLAEADIIVGQIDAQYGNPSDNTTLFFTNSSPYTFTNVTLSGTGYSGGINGQTGTRSFADIAPGATSTFNFDSGATTGTGNVFHSDFDDAFRGAVSYTFSASVLGSAFSAIFSPDSNASGGFIPFLGNDANGNELDPNLGRTTVAVLSATVPEPTSLAIWSLVGGIGAIYTRRRKSTMIG